MQPKIKLLSYDDVIHIQIRTHFARPNWKKVFSQLATTHESSRIGMHNCDAL